MAIFHFSAQVISRSDAGNAVAAAAYRAGQRLQCERTGQVFNYTRKKEVSYRNILAPEGSPAWVFDRSKLFNCIEATETRVNSQLCRQVTVALAVELTPRQHIQLLNEFVQKQFVDRGMVADICLHDKRTEKGDNPHAHILLTLRDITPDGFGAKRRDWNDKALVTQWREAWAKACNEALASAGHTQRIDHRSHKERGIEAPPTVHLGRRTPLNAEAWDAKADFNAWIQTSIELAKVQVQVQQVQAQIIDLTTTLSQALAEREQRKSSGHPVGANPAFTVQEAPAPWLAPEDIRLGGLSLKERIRQSLSRNRAAQTPHSVPAASPAGPADQHQPIHPPFNPSRGATHDTTGIFQGDTSC
jgi:hypothetical protein